MAGSGAIACGVAACASAAQPPSALLARSDASAWRAEEAAQGEARKLDGGAPERIKVTTDPADLADCDLVVEAIAEDTEAQGRAAQRDRARQRPDADLATTTSSLSIARRSRARAARPSASSACTSSTRSTRMELIELCFGDDVRDGVARPRARAWCAALGKTADRGPRPDGFVVNRLLFPYLFEAVRLKESTGMSAADVDACMRLGAGHPMGPLRAARLRRPRRRRRDRATASTATGPGSGADHVPELIARLVAEGKLGRKSGEGFFEY